MVILGVYIVSIDQLRKGKSRWIIQAAAPPTQPPGAHFARFMARHMCQKLVSISRCRGASIGRAGGLILSAASIND